jgi:hypothetical protein
MGRRLSASQDAGDAGRQNDIVWPVDAICSGVTPAKAGVHALDAA